MSELTKRVLFALGAAPVFLGMLWLGGWYFYIMMILIALMVHREMFALCKAGGLNPDYAGSVILLLWLLSTPLPTGSLQIFAVLIMLMLAREVMRKDKNISGNFSSTLFTAIYPGIAFLSIAQLRQISEPLIIPGMEFNHPELALAYTLLFVLMIWGNDIFAYFGGKTFGKHPLAPYISPKKTWEGFFSGFIGGLAAVGITMFFYADVLPDFLYLLPAVLITGIFGPLGDLAASKMKRASQIKDSSTILPGHGGFFDRFDAMMLAAPAYLLYVYFLLHQFG